MVTGANSGERDENAKAIFLFLLKNPEHPANGKHLRIAAPSQGEPPPKVPARTAVAADARVRAMRLCRVTEENSALSETSCGAKHRRR